jgi:hypothetical protein
MIELESLQMIREIVTIFGVIAGVSYYIMTVRNAQKNRMIDMVFQRMHTRSAEYFKDSLDITPSTFDWETVEEFHRKYNWRKTPDIISKRAALADRFTAWGMLLRQGLIDIDFVAKVFPPAFVMVWWERNEPLYQEERKVTNFPEHYEDLEFLYNALKKKYPDIRRNPTYELENTEIEDE